MRILDRQQLQAYYKNLPGGGSSNPQLAQDLKDTQEQLNLILNKWNWDGKNPQSAQEFLGKFIPWVNEQISLKNQLNQFLGEHSVDNLTQLSQKIEQLKTDRVTPKDYEELETERDELKRDKTTLEQEVLAINNRLNLKNQEVKNKDKALEKLKREKNQLEVNHQKALKEKNGLITTLNAEIKGHKEKVKDLEKQIPADKQELFKQLSYFKSTAQEIEKIVDSRLVIFMGKDKVMNYLEELKTLPEIPPEKYD